MRTGSGGGRTSMWRRVGAITIIAIVTLAGTVLPVAGQSPSPGLPGPGTSPAPGASPLASPVAFPAPASEAELGAAATAQLATRPEPATGDIDLAAVDAGLEQLWAGMPESEWTIEGLADAMAFDPTQPFAFVRDRIGFDPYAGVLRGAEGTLAARGGNSWDRALLLKALLDAMLVPTRLVWGELDEATAAQLVTRALEPRTPPLAAGTALAVAGLAPTRVAERARRDDAVLLRTLGDRLQALGGTDDAAAAAEVRRHAWVQALIGTEWQDLDPSLPTAQPGDTLASVGGELPDVPAEDRQAVTIRVVAEHLDAGALTETTVLEHRLDAADAAGRVIALTFSPTLEGLGGTIDAAISGASAWTPQLAVGDEGIAGTSFPAGGRGTDVFGTDMDLPELTALRLELVSSGPGRTDVTAVSPILDRVPPEVRATGTIAPGDLAPLPGSETAPTALTRVIHIMVSTGGLNPRDHLADMGAAVRYVGRVLLDPERATMEPLPDVLAPLMAVDDRLVVGAELVTLPAMRDPGRIAAFVASPRVYLAAFGASDTPTEVMTRYDLALDDVRVIADPALPASAVAAQRLWYGALQSAVETELGLARSRSADPSAARIASASLASGGDMAVLGPGDQAADAGLPGTLAASLAAGDLAVVPAGAGPLTTWWTIRPDGLSHSVLAPGYGGYVVSSAQAANAYKGLRQLPRVPAGQAGGGGGGATSWGNVGGKTTELGGAACRVPASDSTGYMVTVQCVGMVGFLGKLALAIAIDAVIGAVITAAFLSLEPPGYR